MTVGSYSVVIPVYNGEHHLRETIHSVLQQSQPPSELIVVDDGSTDRSAAVAGDMATAGVSVLQKSNGGTASARNFGIDHCHSEYVAFLDADDLWVPQKMAVQLQYVAEHPDTAVVSSLMQNFWEPDLAHEAEENPHLAVPQPGVGSSVVIRRSLFSEIGKLDEQFDNRDIQAWIVKAKSAGCKHYMVDQPLVQRRIHANNLSRQRAPGETELLDIAAKLLAARRKKQRSEDA